MEDGDTGYDFKAEKSPFVSCWLFLLPDSTFLTHWPTDEKFSDWIKVESVSCQTNGSSINFYEVNFSQ